MAGNGTRWNGSWWAWSCKDESYFLCVALSFVSLFFRNEFNFFISLTIISVSVGDALVSLYVRYFYLLPVFLLLFPSI